MNKNSLNVLIVGHACNPYKGSEPGFTWNWAWHLSKYHNVWVVTHPHNRSDIDRYLLTNPNENLNFIWVDSGKVRIWDPSKGERGIRLHYILWQRQVYKEVLNISNTIKIDIVHHVSWGTIGAPPLLWKLPIPFIWGPIGGAQTPPKEFRKFFGGTWPKEIVRGLRIKLLSHLPSFRKAVRKSSLILATNNETASLLSKFGSKNVKLLSDSGVSSELVSENSIRMRDKNNKVFTIIWAGRLEYRKGLPLLLLALSKLKGEIDFNLIVVGDGPLKNKLEKLTAKLGLNNEIKFVGHISRSELFVLFRKADVFVFTSLRDSFGSVVFEAMSQWLPVITLNHQGVGTFLPDNASIKIPVTTPEEVINTLAIELLNLERSHDKRVKLGEQAVRFVQQNTWEIRAEKMSRWYKEVLDENCDF